MAAVPALALITLPLVSLPALVDRNAVWLELRSRETLEAGWLSFRTTVSAVALVVALGLPLAYFSSMSRSWFTASVDAVADLPIVLPPAAAGIALLAAFGRSGWLGQASGMEVSFTPTAVVLAQVFVSMPFFVRTLAEGLRKVSHEDVLSASLDGAGGWRTAWQVVLPQCRNAFWAGILLAWARAVGEFGATLMFAGNFVGRTQTVPLAIYAGFEGNLSRAVALSILLLVSALAVLLLARILIQRGEN